MNLRTIIGSGRPSVSFEIFPPKRPEPSLFGEAEAAAATKCRLVMLVFMPPLYQIPVRAVISCRLPDV